VANSVKGTARILETREFRNFTGKRAKSNEPIAFDQKEMRKCSPEVQLLLRENVI
jgi:hypothetical protein